MYKEKIGGIDYVYLYNLCNESKIKLRDAMKLSEKGKKQLQGMGEIASIKNEFNGTFCIPYCDYLEYMGELND